MTSMYNTWEVAMEAREQLIDVPDFDTELPEHVIETESFGDVSESALKSAGLISDSGPLMSFPVLDCVVLVHWAEVGRGTLDTMVVAGCAKIVRQVLAKAEVRLTEPVMIFEVSTE